MDLLRLLQKGEYITYVVVLFLTALLLVFSLYLAFSSLVELFTAVSAQHDVLAQAIYDALSDIFLVIIFIELINTFILYIEQRRIVVYKVIDVALVALAREVIIYLAPVNREFEFGKAIAIVAATFVVGVVNYLQRKALRPEARRR